MLLNSIDILRSKKGNQLGFSIVEGLLALLLLGAAGISLYSVFQGMDKSTLRNRTQLTMMAVESALVNALQDSTQMSQLKTTGGIDFTLKTGQTILGKKGSPVYFDISSGDNCANFGRGNCLLQVDFELAQNPVTSQWFSGYRIAAHPRVQSTGVIPNRSPSGSEEGKPGDPLNATFGGSDDQVTLEIPLGWTTTLANALCGNQDVDTCCPAGYLIKGYSNGIPQCVRDFYQTSATDSNGVATGTNHCPRGQYAVGILVKTPLGGATNNGSYIDVGELSLNCKAPTKVKCPDPGDIDLDGDGSADITLKSDLYYISTINPAFLNDNTLDDAGSLFSTGLCKISLPSEIAAIRINVNRSPSANLASSGSLNTQAQYQCPTVDSKSFYVTKSGDNSRCVLSSKIPLTQPLVEAGTCSGGEGTCN